jgi:Protein of unknown function (DUF2510)
MAEELRGWHPDPHGVHEQRYFSLDGRPTRLVSDGGRTSHDPPPTHDDLVVPLAVARPPVHGSRPQPCGDPHNLDPEEPTGSARDDASGASTGRSSTSGGPGSSVEANPASLGYPGPAAAGQSRFGQIQPSGPLTPRAIVPQVAAGWYPDPANQSEGRYWDGAGWTEHTSLAIAPSDSADTGPAVGSQKRTRASFGFIEIGLLLVAAALVAVLTVTGHSGDAPLPSASGSSAQRQQATTTSTQAVGTTTQTTTTAPVATDPPVQPHADPSTVATAAGEVFAWTSKYEGNIETLDTDEETIDVADNELKESSGGTAPLDYSPVLSASQQLGSDVATDQKLPAIPDPKAQSYRTAELADLALAAAYYFQGFSDSANGDAAGGPALIQKADTEVDQADIQENNLENRLSVAESG